MKKRIYSTLLQQIKLTTKIAQQKESKFTDLQEAYDAAVQMDSDSRSYVSHMNRIFTNLKRRRCVP